MNSPEWLAAYNRSSHPSFRPALLRISEHGLDSIRASKPCEFIMTHVLSPTVQYFNLDGSSHRGSSRDTPCNQVKNLVYTNHALEASCNPEELLKLTDSVRVAIIHNESTGPQHEKLSTFLHTAVRDEEGPSPIIDINHIQYARLDKMLNEILDFTESARVTKLPPQHTLSFLVDTSNAKNLRRAWSRRFREQYFMLDQRRCAMIVEGGHLKDVSFKTSLIYNLNNWQTKCAGPVSEYEGNQQFEPGHWWLNITCAERDGIVASSLEKPTKGRYGMLALPLLSGREEVEPNGKIKFIREGKAWDMHVALIPQVGRKIRILRGHCLKSVYAPQAGIRYDGLYAIRQYGHKLDERTDVYTLTLTLERVANQRSMQETQQIPKPSQLDDWALYEKLEGDKIKLLDGESTYLEWKLAREREKMELDNWRRSRLFNASVLRLRRLW